MNAIKELRCNSNMTKKEIAEKLGVSVKTYSIWEENFKDLPLDKAQAVANIFSVSLDEIICK